MRSYIFVSKIRIQTALAYRFNMISTILIQCLVVYAISCFWIAAYDGTQTISGVSQRDMITYTPIGILLNAYIQLFCDLCVVFWIFLRILCVVWFCFSVESGMGNINFCFLVNFSFLRV